MQDDVRFAAMPVHPPGVDVWVYGQRQHLGHVCPHAFTATRRGWRKLQVVWQRQANPKSMCVDWSRIIDGVTEGVAIHGV